MFSDGWRSYEMPIDSRSVSGNRSESISSALMGVAEDPGSALDSIEVVALWPHPASSAMAHALAASRIPFMPIHDTAIKPLTFASRYPGTAAPAQNRHPRGVHGVPLKVGVTASAQAVASYSSAHDFDLCGGRGGIRQRHRGDSLGCARHIGGYVGVEVSRDLYSMATAGDHAPPNSHALARIYHPHGKPRYWRATIKCGRAT